MKHSDHRSEVSEVEVMTDASAEDLLYFLASLFKMFVHHSCFCASEGIFNVHRAKLEQLTLNVLIHLISLLQKMILKLLQLWQ